MEFTFLGTGAAEQYPGLWCTCPYCTRARKLGGKNIRRTSSAHFAGDCLIDLPPETFSQAEKYGIAMIPQELNVQLDMTAAENILLGDFPENTPGYGIMVADFYQHLDEFEDDFLEEHDYSREEVLEGLESLAEEYGLTERS